MWHWRVMISVFAAGLVIGSESVLAEANWSDRGPVFGSDLRQQADQEEAERAAHRKSYEPVVYPKFLDGGERPDIAPAAPPIVYFERAEEVGSLIIDTQARKLYYVLPNRQAYEYPISVGREGFTWTGTERISRIATWPSWTPPPEMHERVPGLPITVSGGLKNPQGARALYLGNTIYRIHGTNNDRTVGRSNSSGCFRLTNEHVAHLASIAKVGAKVRVMQSYAGAVSPNASLSSLFDFGFLSPEPPRAPAKLAKPMKPAAAKTTTATPRTGHSHVATSSGTSVIAEAAEPVGRERRMVGARVVEVQLAEPAVRQMQFDLLAEAPLGTDAIAVPNEEHSDHEFGVNGGAPDLPVVGLQFLVEIVERCRDEHVHAPQQVVLRDAILEPELVEELALIPLPPPHHRRSLRIRRSLPQRNQRSTALSRPFSTASATCGHSDLLKC